MKVLSVNKFYYIKGGSDKYFFELNALLEKAGHQIIPFAMQSKKNIKSQYSSFFVSNIEFFKQKQPLDYLRIFARVLYSLEAKAKVERLIKYEKPDIAHLHIIAHQLSPSILSAIRKYDIPIVQTLHDYKRICPAYTLLSNGHICEKCKQRRYYNVLLHRCNKGSFLASALNCLEMYFHKFMKIYEKNIAVFIAPSAFMINKMREFGFSPRHIIHIPNFVDTNKYIPHYGNRDYFLYFGRLDRAKGLYTLLRAVSDMKDVKVYVVGDGELKNDLQDYIAERRLFHVKILGYKSGDELKNLIKNSMFTVLPSECYEICPMSVLESFAFGKPVIGSNIGGIPEIIKDGKNGLLFRMGDVFDLREKIEYLLRNPGLIVSMGKSARSIVEEEYSASRHYQRIEKVYSELLR